MTARPNTDIVSIGLIFGLERLALLNQIRLLIVDDQPRARQSLKALIATCFPGGDVREAADGPEALALVEEFQPDVVLMDVRMPGMDGLEATRLIKTSWPRVGVITLSMYNDYVAEALAAGADAFVCKGDSPEKLLTVLEEVYHVLSQ